MTNQKAVNSLYVLIVLVFSYFNSAHADLIYEWKNDSNCNPGVSIDRCDLERSGYWIFSDGADSDGVAKSSEGEILGFEFSWGTETWNLNDYQEGIPLNDLAIILLPFGDNQQVNGYKRESNLPFGLSTDLVFVNSNNQLLGLYNTSAAAIYGDTFAGGAFKKVPEPQTLLLVGLGILGLYISNRRKT